MRKLIHLTVNLDPEMDEENGNGPIKFLLSLQLELHNVHLHAMRVDCRSETNYYFYYYFFFEIVFEQAVPE